jgi:hypothetical protein
VYHRKLPKIKCFSHAKNYSIKVKNYARGYRWMKGIQVDPKMKPSGDVFKKSGIFAHPDDEWAGKVRVGSSTASPCRPSVPPAAAQSSASDASLHEGERGKD